MKNCYSFLTLLFLLPMTAFTQNQWVQMAELPNLARRGAACFEIQGYGYMAGGLISNGSYTNETWRYDPVNDSWQQVADLPISVSYAVGAEVNGKGYVACGGTAASANAIVDDLWEYDPVLDTWTSRPSFPGTATYHPVAFSIAGELYVGLGNAGSSTGPYSSELWRFDPISGSWTQRASLPGLGRTRPSGTTINGKGYVVGGRLQGGMSTDQAWEYDAITDQWTALPSYPTTIEAPAVLELGGKLLVVGGVVTTGTTLTDAAYAFDQASMTWLMVPDYPGGSGYTSNHFSINGDAYVGFGLNGITGAYINDLWKLDGIQASIADHTGVQQLDLYPNPVGSSSTLWFSSPLEGEWSVRIHDGTGRKVLERASMTQRYLLLPQLRAGVYSVTTIDADDVVRHARLVIDR